jgi:hypothetical protein
MSIGLQLYIVHEYIQSVVPLRSVVLKPRRLQTVDTLIPTDKAEKLSAKDTHMPRL